MLIPLLLACLINTCCPKILEIGGITTSLFKNGQPVVMGLYLICTGSTISFKKAGEPIVKGAILTIVKFLIGTGIGIAISKFFNDSFLGISSLAAIAAITNSNGTMYSALANEYGDETDAGAIAVLSLNDGPFLTMIALGASGISSIPFISLVSVVVPIIIGMILGNLDPEFKKILSNGMEMLIPFCGFTLGANMSFVTIFKAGLSGVLLGLITVVTTGLLSFVIYSLIRRKWDPIGMAVGTTGGNATATPANVALSDPSLNTIVPVATAQIAASCVVSSILTPIITGIIHKKVNKK